MELKNFVILGINYENYTLIDREEYLKSFSFDSLNALKEEGLIEGFIFLPTCLRVEVYLEIKETKYFNLIVKKLKGERFSVIKVGKDAVYYFFQLCCGFYSIIKGEDQILSQIKSALKVSQDLNRGSKIINVIFNKGISLGKEFRNLSKISKNGLSIEGLSINFLEKNLKDSIIDKKILILGTGELAIGILRILKKRGCKNLTITNRTTHTAKTITERFDCKMVGFQDKYLEIAESDIIISATSAPHHIIDAGKLKEFPKENMAGKIFLDLAVPRDIDPKIGNIVGVRLFNLDVIFGMYQRNVKNREIILNEYLYLIDEKFYELKKNLNYKNSTDKKELIIGTRGSKLALAQAEYTKESLEKRFKNLKCKIKIIVTSGDKDLHSNYKNSEASLKSFFTKEIEQELLDKKIDIAVHSMKDMPIVSPYGLICGAIPIREDNRDVLVSNNNLKLQELHKNSIIGTSSLRRSAGVRSIRDDLNIKPIRGNIHTRIEKLKKGEYDAIVLAAAGLKRVGLENLITEYIDDEVLVPAPAQGALYIQCRENDYEIMFYLRKIHSREIEKMVMIEREFSKIFDGGCHTALGCSAKIIGDKVSVVGNYFHNGVEYKECVTEDITKGIAIAQNMAIEIKRRIYEKR